MLYIFQFSQLKSTKGEGEKQVIQLQEEVDEYKAWKDKVHIYMRMYQYHIYLDIYSALDIYLNVCRA